jgi:D-3-phosphoglycerate dehydrogenase / 2-oxoglutarate reductase
MKKVLITTIPFGDPQPKPLQMLKNAGIEYTINPFNRKITEGDLKEIISEYDGLIAGTEVISKEVIDLGKKLKIIARVGVGTDGVDLNYAKDKNIKVTYTPDAPGPAIAELTVGFMYSLLRSTHASNIQIREGKWNRSIGRSFSDMTIGVIGAGRVGSKVIDLIDKIGCKNLIVSDVYHNENLREQYGFEWATKQEIFKQADIITFHVPLTADANGMVKKEQLLSMKKDVLIINTARGGIIDENDLHDVMQDGHIGGVAIDVFEQEPYSGPLINIDRCLLTPHIGSASRECRAKMELESVQEIIRFFSNQELLSPVPEEEYLLQKT